MKHALALTLFAVWGSSHAFGQINSENISHSQWDTKYEAVGGGEVRATLTFNGDGGRYETGGGNGRLSNVNYEVRIGGGATITGDWSFNGVNGSFTFFVAGNSNPPVFSGSWQSNGSSGNWSGRFLKIVQATGGPVVYDETWSYNEQKGYYFKKCSFPAGGYQYIIYYKEKPDWLYWFNPVAQVFWCACPTVQHERWGANIQNGEDLFLMASKKSRNIKEAEFPDEGDNGANFTKGKAKDKDGSEVDLSCPPPDLP